MLLPNLKTFATMLAMYVKQNMAATHRGAMLIRCINDDIMVAAIYGNDNYIGDAQTRREVELVRQQLTQSGVQELGFGLTPDGSSWTILVRADSNQYQTAAGKAFHLEMFRSCLEELVEGAWSSVTGSPLDQLGRFPIPQDQPLP
jgi:hypothetical protein